ncbi:MAG: hypothetical protein D6679_08495 [Candidatus Hydrogenedentota bacterium]|nr:MAG: hypothetical protein D6679_08495 [Candidatus Hydrogenedentota bacterium]
MSQSSVSPLTAVIPAAGRGTRLGVLTEELPKPLLRIDGRRMIEVVLEQAERAGVERFVIITGYKAEAWESWRGDLPASLRTRVSFFQNENWEKFGNGYSVLVAKKSVPERFLLLMSDHLFAVETLADLIEAGPPADECRLLCDFSPPPFLDIGDATKVHASPDGRIHAMGKDLEDFNAVDTGLFYSSSVLFDALRVCCRRGRTALTDANRFLAEQNKMKAVRKNPDRGWWCDIDTVRDLENAVRLFDPIEKRAD